METGRTAFGNRAAAGLNFDFSIAIAALLWYKDVRRIGDQKVYFLIVFYVLGRDPSPFRAGSAALRRYSRRRR